MATFQEIIFGSVLEFFNFQHRILINKTFSVKFHSTFNQTFEVEAVAILIQQIIIIIIATLMIVCILVFDGLREQKEKPKKPGQLPIFFKLALYSPYIFLIFILYQIGLYIVYKIFSQEYILPLVDIPSICFAVIILNRLVNHIIDRMWIKKPHIELLITHYKQKDSQSETVSGYDPIFQFMSIIISSSIGFWYFHGKHWIPSNVLTVAVAYGFIESYSINQPGQKLVMMFTYLSRVDVYLIFFTDTYTKVAQTYNASAERSVPQDLFENGFNGMQYFILGVQHMLIPILLIAYLMRNDHSDGQSNNDVSLKKRNYAYLKTSLAAHFIGLSLSSYIMIVLNNSRPTFPYLWMALVFPIILTIFNGFLKMNFNLRNFEKKLIEIEYTRLPLFRGPIFVWMIDLIYCTGLIMILVYKQVCFLFTSLEICKNQVF